jgi:hypothetical protein
VIRLPRYLAVLLGVWVAAAAVAAPTLATGSAVDLAASAQAGASASAGAAGQKYSAPDAIDENDSTWWAANNKPPQWLELRFAQPQRIDTLVIANANNATLYTNFKSVTMTFSAGAPLEQTFPDEQGPFIIRFPASPPISSG